MYTPNPLKRNKREKGNDRNKKVYMFFETKGSYYFGSRLMKPIKGGGEIILTNYHGIANQEDT